MKIRKHKINKLKEERKSLLKEIGLSARQFKVKLPRVVVKGNGNWETANDSKGKAPSLLQQVELLRDYAISTRALREELEELRAKKASETEQKEKE